MLASLGIQEYDKFLEYLNNNPTTHLPGLWSSGFYALNYSPGIRLLTIYNISLIGLASNFGNISLLLMIIATAL